MEWCPPSSSLHMHHTKVSTGGTVPSRVANGSNGMIFVDKRNTGASESAVECEDECDDLCADGKKEEHENICKRDEHDANRQDTSSSSSSSHRRSVIDSHCDHVGKEEDDAARLASPCSSEHLLMTAGSDPVIKLFDLRSPAAPLHEYRGHHCDPYCKKVKAILPPKFLGTNVIVAQGEGSTLLSLYCVRTGATISRGEMPEQVTALATACDSITRSAAGSATQVQTILRYRVAAAGKRGEVYSLGVCFS